MQNDTSQFVVNIIPLQNIQTNASGLDPTTELANAVANIQQMVNFEQKRVYTDSLSAYSPNGVIQVLSPMNMNDVPFTQNGVDFIGSSGSGGSLTVSTLTVGGNITVNGSGTFTGSVSATSFITVSDRAAKTDIVELTKSPFHIFQELTPYTFRYNTNSQESSPITLGLMAQDVKEVLPEAVHTDESGRLYVNYDSIVAALVGAVKELQIEVSSLRNRL